MRRVPLAIALDAMRAACGFSSHLWIGGVDVPTAVVITRHDRIVAPQRQHKLAAAVPGAAVVEIDGDHGVFLADPDGFADGLRQACAAVTLPVAPTVDYGGLRAHRTAVLPPQPGPTKYRRFRHVVVARLTLRLPLRDAHVPISCRLRPRRRRLRPSHLRLRALPHRWSSTHCRCVPATP